MCPARNSLWIWMHFGAMKNILSIRIFKDNEVGVFRVQHNSFNRNIWYSQICRWFGLVGKVLHNGSVIHHQSQSFAKTSISDIHNRFSTPRKHRAWYAQYCRVKIVCWILISSIRWFRPDSRASSVLVGNYCVITITHLFFRLF